MSQVAELLLSSGAVSFRFDPPFTYASGLTGPIYCDNRKIFGRPLERWVIISQLRALIEEHGLAHGPICMAGVETAGIPWAAWVAHAMDRPMAIARKQRKGHGHGRVLEGDFDLRRDELVLMDDLVNQASSLERIVELLHEDQIAVQAVLSIVNYETPRAKAFFEEQQIPLLALTTFSELVSRALELAMIGREQASQLSHWHKSLTGA